MEQKGFSEKEVGLLRILGFDAIINRLVTGFNYYPSSIELQFQDAVHIPIKYGHRTPTFISLLEKEVKQEFKSHSASYHIPRRVIYQWFKQYKFPRLEEKIYIYDIEKKRHIIDKKDYVNAGNKLLAEGEEESLVFVPQAGLLIQLSEFLLKKGSFFLHDSNGNLVPDSGGKYPYKLNPDRLSDEAYMVPMIITSYTNELQQHMLAFAPVTKLFKIRGKEEVSVYLDKLKPDFIKYCKVKFDNEKKKLANKLFRDLINFKICL